MKWKLIKCLAFIVSVAYLICFPVEGTYSPDQGTDGTELHVIQPSQLEIYLGEEWVGAQFELETDAGMYPNAIPVGEDGTLRLEIGGSSKYILRLNEIPHSDVAATDETVTSEPNAETAPQPSTEPTQAEHAPEESVPGLAEPAQNTLAGIPVKHIVFFGGGLVIAVIALILMRKSQKNNPYYDDEDDI